MTTGKSWQDVVAALDELGIDEARARELGLRVYKVGMTFPLEPEALKAAVAGAGLVMVVEEKRGLIEGQAKEILYDLPHRPRVIGKRDEAGAPFPLARPARRAGDCGGARAADGGADRRPCAEGAPAQLERRRAILAGGPAALVRLPWFCPGCPHNSSTRVPDGSKALAGIGCHFMTTWMGRETTGFTQMGGEGASWLGMAPFSTRPHVFQNIGDGTFYHSGSLAVRAAKAAGPTSPSRSSTTTLSR